MDKKRFTDWLENKEYWIRWILPVLSILVGVLPNLHVFTSNEYVLCFVFGFIVVIMIADGFLEYRHYFSSYTSMSASYNGELTNRDEKIRQLEKDIVDIREKGKKAEAYISSIRIINEALYTLHAFRRNEPRFGENLLFELNKDDKSNVVKTISSIMTDVCNCLSNYFSNVYHTNVNACIKIIVDDKGRPRVITLARDGDSYRKGSRPSSDQDNDNQLFHWIDSNTDFSFIYGQVKNYRYKTNSKNYFYSGDLYKDYSEKNYRNTRIPIEWDESQEWPLPYVSTLVVPLIPLLDTQDKVKKEVQGFLCVDSDVKNCFDPNYDVPLLRGVADGMYDQIKLLNELL